MHYDPARLRLPAGNFAIQAARLAAHVAALAAVVHEHRLSNHLARLVERLHQGETLSCLDRHLVRRALASDDRLWLALLGERPEPLCRAAAVPPVRHHALEVDGVTYPSVAALARIFGIPYAVLFRRLRAGWTPEQAVTAPRYSRVPRPVVCHA